VLALNVAIVVVYGLLGFAIGYLALALIALPAIVVASAIGGWLFFIQHQFEETYWANGEFWDFQVAAVLGSSNYVLPKLLNWFTGSIGLHHIHHLNSMIPNYRLAECLDANPEFKAVNRIGLLESFKCARLALWDEERRCLVSFAEARSSR
jgi:omega-6 fatty acid desaturase (delta-12 desaturase)